MGWLLNGLMRQLMPRLSFATTPVPTAAPWELWVPLVDELRVREYFLGWMFLATGKWRGMALPERPGSALSLSAD